VTSAKDVFIKCDELDRLPPENRDNYLFELEWLAEELPRGCNVLQVGSMDGMRALRLLEARPDLRITGLEIESDLVKLAAENTARYGDHASFVHGDITQPPDGLDAYTYVICLNNTLGFIPDVERAIEQMKRLGHTVVISVYGERFDEPLARRYFAAIGLTIREFADDMITLQDFSSVRRFPRSAVLAWRGDSLVETPIGYLTTLSGLIPRRRDGSTHDPQAKA